MTSSLYKGNWKGKTIAIKIPKLKKEVSEFEMRKLKSEIDSIRKIAHHSNLLPILGACLTLPDLSYFIEFAPDGNLEEIIFNPEIEMTVEQSLNYAYQVCNGLTALHEVQPYIFHGNLKTSNIMVINSF